MKILFDYEIINKDNEIIKTFCDVNKYKNNLHQCLMPINIINNIKVPILFLQSKYDTWIIKTMFGIDCYFDKKKNIKNCNKKIIIKLLILEINILIFLKKLQKINIFHLLFLTNLLILI